MKSLSCLFNLFYPNICTCCDKVLLDQEEVICLSCRFDLPLVDNGDYKTNLTNKVFYGRVPVERAASLLFYHEKGKTKQLISALKYKADQKIGTFLGAWLGKEMLRSMEFRDIDMIIPVPLHKKKLKKRGYNQLTTFGKQLSKLLNTKYEAGLLLRKSFTTTQTRKKRLDRFQNTESRFVVEHPDQLENKHILLIDDVVTTGATLEACCHELLKSGNVKISIATLGITE